MITTTYTPSEAAKILSLSERTLANWRSKCAGIAYVKIGGKVFYREEDINNFIADNVIQPRLKHVSR